MYQKREHLAWSSKAQGFLTSNKTLPSKDLYGFFVAPLSY